MHEFDVLIFARQNWWFFFKRFKINQVIVQIVEYTALLKSAIFSLKISKNLTQQTYKGWNICLEIQINDFNQHLYSYSFLMPHVALDLRDVWLFNFGSSDKRNFIHFHSFLYNLIEWLSQIQWKH